MGLSVATWNTTSLNVADSLMTLSKELSKYKLNLLGVQDVSRNAGCFERRIMSSVNFVTAVCS
jgi:hypothetical protein